MCCNLRIAQYFDLTTPLESDLVIENVLYFKYLVSCSNAIISEVIVKINRLKVRDDAMATQHVRVCHDDVMVIDIMALFIHCKIMCVKYDINKLGSVDKSGSRLLEYVQSDVSMKYYLKFVYIEKRF